MELKLKKIMNKKRWILMSLCLITLAIIIKNVFKQEILNLDIIGYNFISKYLISDSITPIAKIITRCGGAIVLITLSILSLIIIRDKKIGTSICLNLVIITGVNLLLKNIIQRPRPVEFRLIDETGYSFPSGHSMVSVAFYGLIIYFIYKRIDNKKIKWSLITFLSFLVLLIGISRIYLGVHYTSDVIAGFLISISYLIIYITILSIKVLKQ